ncbi:hypothetical protein H311_00400 [Anncaliia algerae PRA109]|nr:hypothetical protein H311_00400 [Anncaliia algerae PRA109]
MDRNSLNANIMWEDIDRLSGFSVRLKEIHKNVCFCMFPIKMKIL